MATIQQSLPQLNGAGPARTPSVIMGRQDYISVLARLIAMELYKIRRRFMSKALLGFGLLFMVGIFFLFGLFAWSDVNRAASSFQPPICAPNIQSEFCAKQPLTQAQLEQTKHNRVVSDSNNLTLPGSLDNVGFVLLNFLGILAMVLMGTIVGGEYSLGTVRLMFTRGPTRLQFLFAKIGAIIVCIVIGVVVLAVVGLLAGLLFNTVTGIAPTYSFFTSNWFGHMVLYLLFMMLTWFVYSIVALTLGVIGRATVVGIVGAIVWFFVEPILTRIIYLVTQSMTGQVHDFVNAIPDYFIYNNVGNLIQNQKHILFGSDPGTLSDAHAWTVLAVYLVVFLVVSCIVTVWRDVTN
jgi:ABC-type transport system involved in multi-copper enzyme maturation permease subunit